MRETYSAHKDSQIVASSSSPANSLIGSSSKYEKFSGSLTGSASPQQKDVFGCAAMAQSIYGQKSELQTQLERLQSQDDDW